MEVRIKSHLIITDIHSEFNIDWCGRLKGANPKLVNGLPLFILKGGGKRIEMNTLDMKRLEKVGKNMTNPRGRSAVMTDETRIFLKEENGNERLMCIITHHRIKTYVPMYDKVGYDN